jgi:hypothetical protein
MYSAPNAIWKGLAGGCLGTELGRVVAFQLNPRNQLVEQNPAIVGIQLSAKRRVNLLNRQLTRMLKNVHLRVSRFF